MNRIQGLGAVTAKRMAERFGSVAAVFDASENDFLSVSGIGVEKAGLFHRELKRVRPTTNWIGPNAPGRNW
jgi:excinuclease UvrABC nuclease subunit